MEEKLKGKKVAVLVANGFEQVEMTEPVKALKESGAEVFIISPKNKVKGWKETNWGDEFDVDVLLDKADAFEYDALLLPGGVMNPDKLRLEPKAVVFVSYFIEKGKPIAAICHGPWTMVETGLIKGFTMTSYPSIKTDLINAGVNWVDQEVVTDNGIVTSRKPSDIPAFNKKMIEEFAEGIHTKRAEHKYGQKAPVKREYEQGTLQENIDTRNFEEETARDPHDDI